jgi:hypothetical protein
MPEYRITLTTPAGPADYTAHAADRARAEAGVIELFNYETLGRGQFTKIHTVPVYGKIAQED